MLIAVATCLQFMWLYHTYQTCDNYWNRILVSLNVQWHMGQLWNLYRGGEWEHLIIAITTNNCKDHVLTLKGYVSHFHMTTKNCIFTIPYTIKINTLSWPDYHKTKENVNIKLLDVCLFTFYSVHVNESTWHWL